MPSKLPQDYAARNVHGPLGKSIHSPSPKGFLQLDGSQRVPGWEALAISPRQLSSERMERISGKLPSEGVSWGIEALQGTHITSRSFMSHYNQRSQRFYETLVADYEAKDDARIEAYADGLMRGLARAPSARGPAPAPAKKVMRDAKSLWQKVRPPVKLWAEEIHNPNPLRRELAKPSPRERFQADLFDRRRFALQGVARNRLEKLEDSVGCNANIRDAYYRGLNEVRRNRYVAYTKLEPPREPIKVQQKVARPPILDKKIWRLAESIWKKRPSWADSGSFYDDEAVYDKTFSLDWSRALRTHKLAEFILKIDDGDGEDSGDDEDLDGDGIADSEIVEVGNALWKHHLLLYSIFDCFASLDAKNGVSSVTYNAFKFFVQDSSLDVPGSKFCDSAHYDQLFIMINSPAPTGGSRRKKGNKELEFTLETVGRRGMVWTEPGENHDKRALSRHEWFNVLVRMAIMRYVQTKEVGDVSKAVEKLLLVDVVPNVDPWISADHEGFRRHVCYTEAVDSVLLEHRDSLHNIFHHFADTEGLNKAKEKKRLNLTEWLNMMKDLELYDAHFTSRDATVVFVLSRMRVIDEQGSDAESKMENLSIEDWYEALCRVAVMKALPTDEEIKQTGVEDAGEFMLQLKQSSSWIDISYEEWVDNWNEAHDAPMVKATQPPHRCLTHLILVIVRTIEATLQRLAKANADAAGDLQISKKEMMKVFGGE